MRRTLEMASSVFALASSSRGTALSFSRAEEQEQVSRGFSEGVHGLHGARADPFLGSTRRAPVWPIRKPLCRLLFDKRETTPTNLVVSSKSAFLQAAERKE